MLEGDAAANDSGGVRFGGVWRTFEFNSAAEDQAPFEEDAAIFREQVFDAGDESVVAECQLVVDSGGTFDGPGITTKSAGEIGPCFAVGAIFMEATGDAWRGELDIDFPFGGWCPEKADRRENGKVIAPCMDNAA